MIRCRTLAIRLNWLAITVYWLGRFVSNTSAETYAEIWVTTQDLSLKLHERSVTFTRNPQPVEDAEVADVVIQVNAAQTYQMMLGLGASFDHSTCFNLSRLSEKVRDEVIARLVDPQTGIGMNIMRICMGTPDFTGDAWYSYDDLPAGQTDREMNHFSIDSDRR